MASSFFHACHQSSKKEAFHTSELSKKVIVEQALALGAEVVGFAPTSRWGEFRDLPEDFFPDRVWPLAKTVIVLGVPVWLPIVEAAPAQLGREQYTITNELLDEAAYRLAAFLNRKGHAAINICRDGYGDSDVLMQTPVAVFSHVWAAHYAGLGKVGWNHTLLTKQFGPRLRLVSILTALELEGDPLIEEELCTKCMLCQKICPANALAGDQKIPYAAMDKRACTSNGRRLRKAYRNPCGFCIKVCPVGADRKLFQSTNVQKYFKEQAVLSQNPDAPEYRSWQHLRKYGGYALEEDLHASNTINKK